jgi:hypothetical protein
VVALSEYLAAAAHAKEFAADFLDAVGLLLGDKRKDGEECESENSCEEAESLRVNRVGKT